MKLEPGPGNRLLVLSPHLHVCRSPAAHLPHRDAAASSLRARTAFRPPLRPATRPRQPSFLPRSSAVARNRFSSSNNPAASTPANQQWDSQMHCSGALLVMGSWSQVMPPSSEVLTASSARRARLQLQRKELHQDTSHTLFTPSQTWGVALSYCYASCALPLHVP